MGTHRSNWSLFKSAHRAFATWRIERFSFNRTLRRGGGDCDVLIGSVCAGLQHCSVVLADGHQPRPAIRGRTGSSTTSFDYACPSGVKFCGAIGAVRPEHTIKAKSVTVTSHKYGAAETSGRIAVVLRRHGPDRRPVGRARTDVPSSPSPGRARPAVDRSPRRSCAVRQ